MNTPIVRPTLFIIVSMFVLLTPWWLSTPIVIGLAIYFPLYIEALVFGFAFDVLYSAGYRFPYIGLTSALLLLLLISFVRTRIRT